MPNRVRCIATLAALLAVATRCSEPSTGSADAGAEAAGPVRFFDGAPPDAPLPICGDARCTEPLDVTALGEAACCLPSGSCGLRSVVLGTTCAPRNPPRGVDLRCPGRTFPGGFSLQGCCGAEGRCGLVDPDGELGCVVEARDAGACTYSADNDCSSIVELTCDGPEDCESGKVCCGRARRNGYDRFGCYRSCDGVIDGEDGVWVEICHPGYACQNRSYVCDPSSLLPDFLARCHAPVPLPVTDAGDAGDAGDASLADDGAAGRDAAPPAPVPGVACGPNTCGVGEKCCLERRSTARGDGSTEAPVIDPHCERGESVCSCSTH